MLKSGRRFLMAILVMACVIAGARAQVAERPDRGVRPNGSYSVTDLENISLNNGNVNMSIPLAGLPPMAGGKLSWTMRAIYNSKMWDSAKIEIDPLEVGLPNYVISSLQLASAQAWKIAEPYRIDIVDSRDEFDWQLPPPTDPEYNLLVNNDWVKIILTTPDGATHELRPKDIATYNGPREFLKGYTQKNSTIFGNALRFYSYDGSFLWAVLYPEGNAKKWEVYLPDGTQIVQRSGGKQIIRDTNGNEIEIWSQENGLITTTHFQEVINGAPGREILYEFNSSGSGQGLVKYQTVGGNWVTITINFDTTFVTGKPYIIGDPDCPDAAELADADILVVREILLPQTEPSITRKFSFEYNSDPIHTQTISPALQWRPNCSTPYQNITTISKGWGALRKMTLPTGAKVEYAYNLDVEVDGLPTGPTDAVEAPKERIVSKKLIHDSITDTWTYNIASTGGTVTGPDGSVTTETFYPHDPSLASQYGGLDGKGGLVYRSNQSGKVITERHWIFKNFNGGGINATGSSQLVPFNPVVDAEYTTLLDNSGVPVKMNARTYIHDFNGNVTQVKEYDWFSPSSVGRDAQGVPTAVPAGATLVRTTLNDYHNPAPVQSSSNVYANRILSTAQPLILNAMMQSSVGASITQLKYDGQAYGVAPSIGNVTEQAVQDNATGGWLRTSHGYDSFGNRASTTDPMNNLTQFTFGDSTHANPTQITVNPLNGTGAQTTNIVYDIATGLVTSQTDANGQLTQIDYTNQRFLSIQDPFGRPGIVTGPAVSSTVGSTTHTNQRRKVKTLYFDSTLKVEAHSDLNTQGDYLLRTRSTSDQIGRVTLTESSENGSSYTISAKNVYKYRTAPNKGTITFTSNPYKLIQATTDGWTRATTDEIGRVVEVASFGGFSAITPPDEGTNANWTGSVITTYDAEKTTVRDQAGKQRRSTTDGVGRLKTVEELNQFPATSVYSTTSYGYDALGNLTSVLQGGQTRAFTYDSLSRLKSANNPESGTINYTYDDNSNLKTKTDARGITATYFYDGLNRVISRTYSDGTPTVTYAYDSPGVLNSKGRLTQVSSSVSSYSYDEYDAEGKVMRSAQMTDGQAYLMDYAYNLAGAMTRETYPSGRVVSTSYDNAGRVSGVTGQKPGEAVKTYTSTYTYTAHGAVASMKFGTTANRFEHTFFNSRLQPTEIGLGTTTTSTSELKLMFTYGTNNNNGNILTQAITANGLTFNQDYTYDQVNRLLVAQENGGSNWKQTFSYDVFGNRRFDAANTTANALGPNPTISATNNRINAAGYGYDSAGNMNVEPGKTYAFDGENRIKNYNSGAATYHYDGDGRRVKKVVGTVTTLMVYNASGQLIAEYNSPDQPSSGGTRYLTTDHLGSTRVVMDAAGVVVARHDYLPFGEEIASSVGGRSAAGGYGFDDGIRQKFTSKERDSESGLDYFLARYYSSGLGRFTSVDPLDPVLGKQGADDKEKAEKEFRRYLNQPQHWNRYPYVLNNPLRFVDPDGFAETISVAVNIVWDKNSNYTDQEKEEIKRRYLNEANRLLGRLGIKLVVVAEGTGTATNLDNKDRSIQGFRSGKLNVFFTKNDSLPSTEVTHPDQGSIFIQTHTPNFFFSGESPTDSNLLAHGALHAFGIATGKNGYWNNIFGKLLAEEHVTQIVRELSNEKRPIRWADSDSAKTIRDGARKYSFVPMSKTGRLEKR